MTNDFSSPSSLLKAPPYAIDLLEKAAHALRFLSADMVEKAKSGHPGLPMGMADVVAVLFFEFLTFYPKDPHWPLRDRFILSAGHGSALLYSVLHMCGYETMTMDALQQFRKWQSLTPGHPEYGHTEGVEATTGPLGQGIAMAVGMAIAQKITKARLGESIGAEALDHKIYVLASDGDLMEGISQEALSLAGHLKLDNLIVLFDDNGITIDGTTDLSTSDQVLERFKASHWHTRSASGHDFAAIRDAFSWAKSIKDGPSIIAFKTIIGKGAPLKAGMSSCHGSPLGSAELLRAKQDANWPVDPFVIPESVVAFCKGAANRHQATYIDWMAQHKEAMASYDDAAAAFSKKSVLSDAFWSSLKDDMRATENAPLATRVAFQKVLDQLVDHIPGLVGGSADLTPSNNTKTKKYHPITSSDFSGNYVHFGIREHAMAAAMNGMALYGGILPYGGTFLVFSDYLRPALRLSALMKKQVLYVFTHDSIGLGEDGPTHQPVEHLAALRAMPNVYVFRPCDIIEMAECWQMALSLTQSPSLFALSRHNLPLLRTKDHGDVDGGVCRSQRGAYVLRKGDDSKPLDVTIMATGSEVHLACLAFDHLTNPLLKGASTKALNVQIVSVPCLDLFHEQDDVYRTHILGNAPILVIEAGTSMGWDRYLWHNGKKGAFIGVESFGASAPFEQLYEHFNITVESIIQAAERIALQ